MKELMIEIHSSVHIDIFESVMQMNMRIIFDLKKLHEMSY
uniref:Uncharacterized protein n=1 Tax=Arundo donax TaxID=35708 RepID=A0A0A9DB42_ARUDO